MFWIFYSAKRYEKMLESKKPKRNGTFLTAEWKDLAMINYETNPAILLSRVPRGTELDPWNGRTFISIVGFLFQKTRLLGLHVPFHEDFEEVNLRFYVRRKTTEGWRRGVVFIKEIVPKWAIAAIARFMYNENYVSFSMRHSIEEAEERIVQYDWRSADDWNSIRVKTKGVSSIPDTGSHEEYITERHWGYSLQQSGGTVEYRAEHPRWQVWTVSESILKCDVKGLYGPEFVSSLGGDPYSAFLAEGSAVRVLKGHRITDLQ